MKSRGEVGKEVDVKSPDESSESKGVLSPGNPTTGPDLEVVLGPSGVSGGFVPGTPRHRLPISTPGTGSSKVEGSHGRLFFRVHLQKPFVSFRRPLGNPLGVPT